MVPGIPSTAAVRRHVARTRAAAVSAGERCLARPPVVAAALALLALGYAAVRLFSALPAGTWPWLGDSVIFEYVGWFLAEGNRLYIDVWEVKPPLSFEVTALLAVLAGDHVALYHVLNLLANAMAIDLGAAVAAALVHDLTDDRLAAVVAGVAPFALPTYFYPALVGFKPKYLVIATGLGCLWLAFRERSLVAGADDLDGVERQYVYWNRVPIANCRAFGAANQQRLVRRLGLAEGQRWETAPCGRFDPTWRAVRSEYGFGGGNATATAGRDTQR